MRIMLFATLAVLATSCRPQGPYATETRCITTAWETLEQLGDEPCPGWSSTHFAVLLVTDSTEYLFGHPYPSDDFAADPSFLGPGTVVSRPRMFPPNLLATMPAVNGLPTVVIGTLANTGLSPGEWTSTLLHEHFHQVQFNRPGYYDGVNALELSGGDETGMWMLNYPFCYTDTAVVHAFDRYRSALLAAFAPGSTGMNARNDMIAAARRALFTGLSPKDARYLDLQLWQEGTARSMEQHVLELLVAKDITWKEIDADTRSLAQAVETNAMEELTRTDLANDQRICFYAVGWAEARLAVHRGASFWRSYFEQPFTTATYFQR
ncbi:MAG: hypothetical protein IPJ76_08535 [Flavobacteriales bacterium]|nr:MAG: hypothetical protein IPJ76_08535 [Flavobacteriales bacterium]